LELRSANILSRRDGTQARSTYSPNRFGVKRRVCVFCGSSLGNDDAFARTAEGVARAIVRAGYGIVYGGGSIGLMGVLADTAMREGGEVVGVIPRSLARAEIAHSGLTRLELVDSMHERKARMLALSDAVLALPGAFGTMDELCEMLSWRQLGIHSKPVGLLDVSNYYEHLIALFDDMVRREFLSPENRRLIVAADEIDTLLARMGLTPAQ
jgi:uncharacterized protein (TIGR00730 family)